MPTQLPQQIDLLSPTANVGTYIQAVTRIPILEKEQEIELARRYRTQDDLEAARQITIANLRFVVHIARSYRGYNLPMGDIIQEGNIGLMKAIKKFDPDVGVRISTYSVYWIKAEIHEFIIKNWKMIKIASTADQRRLFFKLRSLKPINNNWLTKDEAALIANDLKVPMKQVYEMEKRLAQQYVPLESDSEDTDEPVGPIYKLTDQSQTPEEELIDNQFNQQMQEKLKLALKCLDNRTRDIISMRQLQENKSTLQQVADKHNITAERVRQLESEAIKKLKSLIVS